jgi:hypothetical protein
MMAYKFLAAGAVAPFSRAGWPTPSGDAPAAWVVVEGPLVTCANGVHACSRDALAYWFDDELWAIELAGEIVDAGTALVARRGRLLERIAGWPAVSPAFASDCAAHARRCVAAAGADARLAEVVADADYHAARAQAPRDAVVAAYAAAVAAGAVADGGFEAERARQSDVLARLLGIPV